MKVAKIFISLNALLKHFHWVKLIFFQVIFIGERNFRSQLASGIPSLWKSQNPFSSNGYGLSTPDGPSDFSSYLLIHSLTKIEVLICEWESVENIVRIAFPSRCLDECIGGRKMTFNFLYFQEFWQVCCEISTTFFRVW